MPYQVPKKDHPWRAYRDRFDKSTDIKPEEPKRKVKPVKIFLTEIVDSWETMEIITTAYGREGRFNMSELPEGKKAAWLVGILRRNYVK